MIAPVRCGGLVSLALPGFWRLNNLLIAGLLAIPAGIWCGSQALFSAQTPATPPSTDADWNPTTGLPPAGQYVGRAVCTECHVEEAGTQPTTPMGQAAQSVATCEILRKHPVLKFRFGPYNYQITRDGDQSIYSVSEGTEKNSAALLWALGMGEAGQTYIFERMERTTRAGSVFSTTFKNWISLWEPHVKCRLRSRNLWETHRRWRALVCALAAIQRAPRMASKCM